MESALSSLWSSLANRTRPKTGSPALLSSRPWAHRCPAHREGVSSSLLILTLQDVGPAWSLYSLLSVQLRSSEEPHRSSGHLSRWTGKEHTQTSLCFASGGLELPSLPVSKVHRCGGRGVAMVSCSEIKQLPASPASLSAILTAPCPVRSASGALIKQS